MRDGILVVNKPRDLTSHDVVAFARRKLKVKKIGHAGTLDPMATGVLVLLVGRCTRLFDSFLALDKEYRAVLRLGSRTDTADARGKVVEEKAVPALTPARVEEVCASFLGQTMQVPPMYSAVKHQGKRLYKLAMKGQLVERQARPIVIKEFSVLRFQPPEIEFRLRCSKGTYVRQLAEDVAAMLGTVGHISSLEREGVGPFTIRDSLSLDQIAEDQIRPYYPFLDPAAPLFP